MPSPRPFLLACLAGLTVTAFAQIPDTEEAIGQKALVPNNRWAMVIGVSNYSAEVGPLRFTAKEAREFAGSLTEDLSFDKENIKLLADGGTPDQAPTSQHILASLDALLADKRLDKGNLFVFYFSGHGVGTPSGDYLLPADAKKGQYEKMGVPVHEVIERIVHAGLKNVLFIADACRSGTENDFGANLSDLCRKANIAVILGCSPGRRSYEYATLQQGAFTHFLLEDLKNPKLRDVSGALWASKLGTDVQTKVHDFTERDQGENAQVPALWGDASTLDVLLGAFPQPPVTDEAVLQFKLTASKLNRADYAVAMMSYAAALSENDRTDEAVTVLKTVDQLGELTPAARYTLAVSLDTLGRTGEAERVYATFQTMEDGYWKDLATATSSSRAMDPAKRIASAMRLFDTDPVWGEKLLAWGVIDLWGSYDQKLAYAKKFVALSDQTLRQRHYAEAQLAFLQGRWADSVKAFELARKSPGDTPSDLVVYTSMLAPTVALGDPAALDRYLAQDIGKGLNAGFAFLERAQIAKNKGDLNGRLTYLKKALASPMSPGFLLLAAKIAGPYIGTLQNEFKAAAEKHPYSWRARLVLYFIRKIQGDAVGMEQDAAAANRYMDDEVTFYTKLFDFMESFMEEAVQLKRLDISVYRSQMDLYFLMMKDYAPKFGYDADLWMQLARYGMVSERNAQVDQFFSMGLPFAPEQAPKDLKPILMLLAMNRGDTATVDKLFNGAFEPTERRDPTWFYACYLASQGRAAQAYTLIEHLGPPSEELRTRMEALRTYLLAKIGRRAEARKRITKSDGDIVLEALNGLTYAELGDWAKAEPLLQSQSGKRVWTFLCLQEFATHQLDQHYRQTAKWGFVQDLAMLAAISQPGNPLFAHYSFVAKPGVAQFAGSTSLEGGTIDDRNPNLMGSLLFTVTPPGALSGAFVDKTGAKHTFTGTVDGYGNVTGRAEWMGKKATLTGKIAPAALYKSYAKFKTIGQVFQLVDEEGFRIVLLGRA